MLKLNIKWKEIVRIQLIGYFLAIFLSPVSICMFVQEHPSGARSWITFPIISFIVWMTFIVLPVVYAYIKSIEHKKVCFMILWIPPVIVFSICIVSLLMNIITLL